MAPKHYVFLYRDSNGDPVYVGQGFGPGMRSNDVDPLEDSKLQQWLSENTEGCCLDVVGPFERKEIADAIEAAIISTCKGSKRLSSSLINLQEGKGKFAFRPYRAPSELLDRVRWPLRDVHVKAIALTYGPIIFVEIGFSDRRLTRDNANDLSNVPVDEDLIERSMRWWQISRFLPEWQTYPERSPFLLVGVSGSVGSQRVVTSFEIDRQRWGHVEKRPSGLATVPLKPQELDALALRGRPIALDVCLNFKNAFRHQKFRLYGENGFFHPYGKRIRIY